MNLPNSSLLALIASFCIALVACKPAAKDVAVDAPPKAASPALTEPTVASSGQSVDLEKIPVSQVVLPPFPYIDYPASIPVGLRFGSEAALDETSVIVGHSLHNVVGRYKVTHFSNSGAQLSKFQALRDYRDAAVQLGGVKVNLATPDDEVLQKTLSLDSAELAEKLRYENGHSYDAYLIPTPQGRVWIVVMVSEDSTRIVSIQEKQVASSVKLVSADAIKSELDSKGHMALYIHFDSDRSVILPDGAAAVAEVATVMKQDPSLRLVIEGHTDNSGERNRNTTLSLQRAQAVVERLVVSGIDQSRLSAKGLGAEKPLADNSDDAGRAKNRRVELVKVSQH